MFLEFQVGGPSSQAFLFHLGLCILRRPHPGGSSSAPMSICRKTRAPVQWGCCSSPRNPLQRAGGHRSWIKSYQNLVINYFSGLIFCGFIGFLRTSKSRISTTDSNTQRVLSCCRKQQGKDEPRLSQSALLFANTRPQPLEMGSNYSTPCLMDLELSPSKQSARFSFHCNIAMRFCLSLWDFIGGYALTL